MTILDALGVHALERELAQIYTFLDYAMHELPAGVLWGPDAANDLQCAELLVDLSRFEELSKQLTIPAQDFIDACRWHLDHYPHYRSRQRHFVDYVSYCIHRGGPLRIPLLAHAAKFKR